MCTMFAPVNLTAELERHRSSLSKTGQERFAQLALSTRQADRAGKSRPGTQKAQAASALACCSYVKTVTA